MKKAKRFISIFMAMLMCLSPMWSGLSVISFAVEERTVVESGECGENITYTLYDDGKLVISGEGAMYNYDVFEDIPWYSNRKSIVSIEIKDGITSIASFSNCENMVSVIIPDSVTYIGGGAFYNCKSLAEICIPKNLSTIGELAIYNCYALKRFIVDENNSVYSSDENGILFNKEKTRLIQFPSGNPLTVYNIPESVKSISMYAFNDCNNLISISIPKDISIGEMAFSGCDNITDVYFAGTEEQWESYCEDGIVSFKNAEIHFLDSCAHLNKTEEKQQEPTCNKIGYTAGVYCPDCELWIEGHEMIESINHKNKTEHIEQEPTCAKTGYTAGIYCPDCKTWIYGHVRIAAKHIDEDNNVKCDNCEKEIRNIVSNGVCGDNALWVLYEDGELIISGEGAIEDNYFYGYNEIKSVIITEGITSIGGFAFSWCENLESIIIPNSVTSIGNNAFHECSLANICVADNNQNYMTKDGVLFNKERTILIVYPGGIKNKIYIMPDSVTKIESGAFEHCRYLEEVVFSEALTKINGFYDCSNLKSITIPESVIEISGYAFYVCGKLKHIGYKGTQDKWKNITISEGYGDIKNVPYIHYNFSFDSDITTKVTAPTCDKRGYTTYSCSCGYSYDTNYLDATGRHNYESIVTDPTCTKDGYTTHTCSICKDAYKDTIVAALGHNYSEWKVTTEPTCTKTGIEKRTCDRCGNVESQSVAALGHDYSKEWTIDKKATCTVDGSKSHHCIRCNDKADVTVIPAHGHNYESVVTDPTCTKEGYTTHTCSICKDAYKDTIVAALGHNYGDWKVTTEPTCTKTGIEKRTCDRCGNVESQSVAALGHDYSKEWTIDKKATCTEDGSKSHHCSRCNDKTDVTVIPAHGHNYESVVTDPTCTKEGYTTHTCSICKDTYKDTIVAALGHNYGKWKVTAEPTCTKKGIEKRTCARCSNVESQDIAALGHNYSKEWTIDKKATCTVDGSKSHHCSRCNEKTDITVIDATGHNYGDWIIEKEATIFVEGSRTKACSACKDKITETIEKTKVNIDETEDYGLANFTVVNAQSLEPIEGASIYILTETDGDTTLYTDENGKVSSILPVGKFTVSAYAKDCILRNLKITVKPGINDMPKIGLSNQNVYDVELDHHPMTDEEIKDAGIDTSAPGNNHVYKYELKLNFEPQIDWMSICYYMNTNGEIVGGGGSDSNGKGSWVDLPEGGGYYHKPADKEKNEEAVSVYPISEYFYLIVYGDIKWLKEMFDVEMLVINNSNTDTLEELVGTLNLPEGLSLAEMKDYEQLASQQIGTIPEGGHKSVHWYVRGDKAGNYNLEAKLDGMIMPFEEEIHDTFVTKNSLNVWAGNALNLHFEFPSTAYYAEDYPITITLTNVSDVTLYNLHQMIEIQQGMEIYYHNGKDKIRIENSEPELTTIKEFKPGDKLIVETTVNIFFESDVMKNYLESLIGIVDKIEELIAFYDFFNVIWKLSDGFIKAMDGISKALDFKDVVLSSMDKSKKDATKKLYDSLSNLYSKYKVSDNKSINKGADLVNYGISELLDVIATGNILDYLLNLKVSDIEKLSDKVSAFAESFEPTDEEIKNFDIFDSIRTMISAIPVCFVLSDVIMTENKNNTTQIPWTYSVSEASPNYFGVTNVSSYLFDIMTACGAEAWDRASLGLLGLIPGVDDPFNYDDVKKRIIATEKEIEKFQAKTATGDVTFNVHYVSNSGENDYTLTCDNETADFNNGILSFKGDGSISLIPESTAGGTLYIEDSEGRKYTYEIETVEQHKCVAGEHEIIVNSTAETNGFAVECCETCKDIMGVVELSVDDCEEHSYSEWVVESAATCTTAGAESRLCSNCGYKDLKFIEAMGHDERTVDKTEPTCTENGYTGEVVCKSCGITISTGKDIPTLGHNMSDFLVLDTPTCTNDGANISICSRCDYSEMVVVHAHGHNYIDGVCENCGDNKTAGCSCNCHKKGFMGFIWKILKVFYKLFKTNKTCACGVAHY